MTLVELVKYLRQSILDDTGGTGVVWEDLAEDDVESAQLRWSNEELTSFINSAQERAVRAAFLIKKAESDFDIAVTAGTSEYSLNPLVIRLRDVRLNSTGRSIDPLEFEDLLEIPNWRTKTGTPLGYVLDESDRTIRLYPVPLINDTIELIYYRLPLESFDWIRDPYATSEIPEEFQIDMLDYAAALAYTKDEANTFDPTRSEYFRQRFQTNFTSTNAYAETRRRRSRGRTVKYRDVL